MKSDKRTLHKINRKCTNTFCIATVYTKYKQTAQKILLSTKTKWRIQFRQLCSFFSIFVIRIFCLFNKEKHEHGKSSCTIKAYIGRNISWHVFFGHFPLWSCKRLDAIDWTLPGRFDELFDITATSWSHTISCIWQIN